MEASKRIEWVDVVKYICILMVMLSHLEARTDVWSAFYTPFFLSAFFFVSGYVYKPKDSFNRFLYKKFRQLFVPWLVFNVFNILLSQALSFNEHAGLLSELTWNFLQIRGKGDGIWFVAALFVAFIPFYFFINWYENRYENKAKKIGGGGDSRCILAVLIAWVLSFVSVLYSRLMPAELLPWNSTALPWHIEYMFQAMFWMVLGYMFRGQFEGILDRRNTVKNRVLVWLLYLVTVYVPFVTDIKLPMLVDVVYDYMAAWIGITVVIMTAKTIKSNAYINSVGQNTLIYFALHGKAYSVIQTVLKKMAGGMYSAVLGNTVVSSVFALLFSLMLSVLLIVPAWIINRWFPFVMGRSRK